jgi:hypothetical protein
MKHPEPFLMTVGKDAKGREIAIITSGGHPQIAGSGPCTILTLELVENMPNKDIKAWFEQMKQERPWETRQ